MVGMGLKSWGETGVLEYSVRDLALRFVRVQLNGSLGISRSRVDRVLENNSSVGLIWFCFLKPDRIEQPNDNKFDLGGIR